MPGSDGGGCIAHLVTVGTSVLSNVVRFRDEVKQLLGEEEAGELVSAADACMKRGDCEGLGSRVEDLVNLVSMNPERWSAELAAMRGIIDDQYRRGVKLSVDLLVTDTPQCKVAADVLARVLGRLYPGVVVAKHVMRGVSPTAKPLWPHLITVAKAASIVTACRVACGCEVWVNPTGGFKPEGMLVVLSASACGASLAYYRHELARSVQFIPLIHCNVPGSRYADVAERLRGYLKQCGGSLQCVASRWPTLLWVVKLIEEYVGGEGGEEKLGEAVGKLGEFIEAVVSPKCRCSEGEAQSIGLDAGKLYCGG